AHGDLQRRRRGDHDRDHAARLHPIDAAHATMKGALGGVAVLAAALQTAEPSPFILGVAGRAGVQPIARFDGREWARVWPEPAQYDTPAPALDVIPESWLGGPVPRVWTLWRDGARTTSRVTSAIRDKNCEAPIVLT